MLTSHSLENNHRQQLTFLQSQIDEFVEELKVKENSLNEATIQLEELRKQVVKNDEKILRNLILAEEDSNGMEYHCQIEDSTEDVRALVVSLLVQWRDQVGFYPRAAKAQISKAEEKFLQNVTDLVMESHQRATKSEHRLRTLQFSNYQLERQKKVQTIHLQRVMMALVKSQRKSSLYDEFGLKVSLEHLKQEVTVSTLLKNTNRKLMTMLESISQELISQKCHENHLQNSSCPVLIHLLIFFFELTFIEYC